jgi:hypothetical protein
MSEREPLARFHDWRTARDREAVTRRQSRSRCIALMALPVFIGLAGVVMATRALIVTHSAAQGGADAAHGPLTYSDEGDV